MDLCFRRVRSMFVEKTRKPALLNQAISTAGGLYTGVSNIRITRKREKILLRRSFKIKVIRQTYETRKFIYLILNNDEVLENIGLDNATTLDARTEKHRTPQSPRERSSQDFYVIVEILVLWCVVR